jgi:alkanesulfonate monooxygenase SsuD/methylene tetrahydromethanopterin reductase-like flavin-dependent oxidoreductase (luciferase family)
MGFTTWIFAVPAPQQKRSSRRLQIGFGQRWRAEYRTILNASSTDRVLRRGLFLAPFDELADPVALMELAILAESRGWDGLFLWDHISYRPPVSAVSDPWVALSAIAAHTQRLRLGPMVTPLSRRRVQKVARETVTLDRLSGGRLTLGVGLGSDRNNELEPYGEVVDARERAHRLDDGLKRLTEFWGGKFEPRPVQQPRIPVWVAGRWPHRRPITRAAAWDGMFPIELPGPDALALLAADIKQLRPQHGSPPFDLVVEIEPADDVTPWHEAGATWVLTGFGPQPRADEVREVIESGR